MKKVGSLQLERNRKGESWRLAGEKVKRLAGDRLRWRWEGLTM